MTPTETEAWIKGVEARRRHPSGKDITRTAQAERLLFEWLAQPVEYESTLSDYKTVFVERELADETARFLGLPNDD